jgi:GMP synthase-like glutamine amidotransferase
MKIHALQHVPFEDPANIVPWAVGRGHSTSGTKLYTNDALPRPGDFDWLVIMGGPMNIYEEKEYPWLRGEKKLIADAVAAGKTVLGICLGAQLLADVLGARVFRNEYKEIGWFPVTLTAAAEQSPLFGGLPGTFTAFHWHGDTFDIPPGCIHTAESKACAGQAFEFGGGRVVALQFHLESSVESIERLILHCGDELTEGKYVQSAGMIRAGFNAVPSMRGVMDSLLEAMEARCAAK